MVVQVKFLGFCFFLLLFGGELGLGSLGVCIGVCVLGSVGACVRGSYWPVGCVNPSSSVGFLVVFPASSDVVPHGNAVMRDVVVLDPRAATLSTVVVGHPSPVPAASDIDPGVPVSPNTPITAIASSGSVATKPSRVAGRATMAGCICASVSACMGICMSICVGMGSGSRPSADRVGGWPCAAAVVSPVMAVDVVASVIPVVVTTPVPSSMVVVVPVPPASSIWALVPVPVPVPPSISVVVPVSPVTSVPVPLIVFIVPDLVPPSVPPDPPVGPHAPVSVVGSAPADPGGGPPVVDGLLDGGSGSGGCGGSDASGLPIVGERVGGGNS